ncbi:BatA domain-containing protein [Larkinella sp. VNQ87]|uniref:BatA domain-containing protein n=1 Tax=Larkinella sp. VNQ87 TaxID=3400921 RepID=UPI003C0BECD5
MELLQPGMLWGMSAVVIPVVIHFWHQKKGRTLAWAATRWLREKDQQQQRGLKFDNLLLLLLRCLLILLLAFLLSQPVLTRFAESAAIQKIHLVQPDPLVVDNFRFELAEALKKGEAVFWSNAATERATDATQLPEQQAFSPTVLQTSVNNLLKDRSELHLYVLNNRQLAEVPFIRVPAGYQLHTIADSARRLVRRYLDETAGKKVFVDRANRLTTQPVLASDVRFESTPAHSGPLAVLLRYRDRAEEQTVAAALAALSDVYGLVWQLDRKSVPGKKYDWVLTDQAVTNPDPATLYVVSNTLKIPTVSNVIYVPESLSPQTGELARTGQLPEWLADILIRHFKLNPDGEPLRPDELKTVFVPTARPEKKQPESVRTGLLAVFVVLVGVERWMALKKNA